VTVVVWLVLPLLPVTVIVRVPTLEFLLTLMVIVEVPAPVIEVGLNVTVCPLPCPEADNEIAELNPPVTVLVIVTEPEVPLVTVIEVGDALREKPGFIPVTVSETVVVWVLLPAVPVTMMLYVPGVVDDATVIVIVEEPFPVIDVGLKVTVTPEGCPDADNETGELNPPVTVLVIVEFPELPTVTVTEDGDAERLKPGVELDPISALIRPDPLGLPQPVARS